MCAIYRRVWTFEGMRASPGNPKLAHYALRHYQDKQVCLPVLNQGKHHPTPSQDLRTATDAKGAVGARNATRTEQSYVRASCVVAPLRQPWQPFLRRGKLQAARTVSLQCRRFVYLSTLLRRVTVASFRAVTLSYCPRRLPFDHPSLHTFRNFQVADYC